MHRLRFRYFVLLIAVLTATKCGDSAQVVEPGYDPLALARTQLSAPQALVIQDKERSREIPLRVFLPAEKTAAPVVLFSHGLGGSRENNTYLGTHWAARGFAVVFMQHPGSDEAVWRDARPLERMAAMERAANLENFMLRAKDVSIVLDRLDEWNRLTESTDDKAPSPQPSPVRPPRGRGSFGLAGRLDMDRVGMSGHSFGAVTTQAVSGQTFVRGRASLVDARIKAAVALSPSGPRDGVDPTKSFGQVKIPWMLMTGTKDRALVGKIDVKSRLSVFPALPPGGKYELVLDRAEHSAFNERSLPGDKERRNPNHHRVILALSTAFWDAYLREDASAKAWLDGKGPRNVLEAGDRWQRK